MGLSRSPEGDVRDTHHPASHSGPASCSPLIFQSYRCHRNRPAVEKDVERAEMSSKDAGSGG